jgi:hypothetical protein
MVLGDRRWAAVGLLLALHLQAFTGVGKEPASTLWMCPSSTVLRYLFDVWFFLALWLHLQSRRVIWAACCGIAVGLSLGWVLDTGIYLFVVAAIYCVMRWHRSKRGRDGTLATPLAIFGIATPLAAASWLGASRGSLGPEFFWGISEAVRNYPAGIGCLPFSTLDAEFAARFSVVCGTYLFALTRYLVKWMAKEEPSRADTFNACLGTYGLALLLIFIQRTHPFNLSHGIVPFVILATEGVLSAVRYLSRRMVRPDRSLRVLANASLLLATGILFMNPNLRAYPGWLQTRLTPSGPRQLGLGSVVGVGGLSPDSAERAAHFRSLTSRLAELQKMGHRVAIISDFDPIYCLAASVPPIDRYSPLSGHLFEEPLQDAVRRFRENPFDFVFIQTEPPNFCAAAFQQVVEQDYTLWERHGSSSILRRRADSRPDTLATSPSTPHETGG